MIWSAFVSSLSSLPLSPAAITVIAETVRGNVFPGMFFLSLWKQESLGVCIGPSHTFKTLFGGIESKWEYRSLGVIPPGMGPCCARLLWDYLLTCTPG